MKNVFERRTVSIFLTGVFVVISITGMLLFFKTASPQIGEIHAWLGLAFLILGIYHLIKNFSLFKRYLKKKSSVVILMLILVGSILFIKPWENPFHSPMREAMMKAIFMQPISTVSTFFKKDPELVLIQMQEEGIAIRNSGQSLMEISKSNGINIKVLLTMIFEDK